MAVARGMGQTPYKQESPMNRAEGGGGGAAIEYAAKTPEQGLTPRRAVTIAPARALHAAGCQVFRDRAGPARADANR